MHTENNSTSSISYPDGKSFIFTIFDDTDVATLNYIKPIYDRFIELNMKTTKTVWPLGYSGESHYKGSHSLEDQSYLEYIQFLQKQGFEISFHGASMNSREREEIIKALESFHEHFGTYPKSYAAHSDNRDNLYWGKDRFSLSIFKTAYNLLSSTPSDYFQGHVDGSPFFWEDLAKQHIQYMRNFTFDGINLLNKKCPLPYKNPKKPWSNFWFYTCDADNVESFNALFCEENQDQLVREKGVCIVSTHLGKGFTVDGRLHPETDRLLTRLSKENGWFAPVTDVLNFLADHQKTDILSLAQLIKLESEWFVDALIRRKKNLPYTKTEVPYLLGER